MIENARASAAVVRREAALLDDHRSRVLLERTERALVEANRTLKERNHAYTFFTRPGFSFGEGWYVAAAALLAQACSNEPAAVEEPTSVAADAPRVFIISPTDGETVTSPVTVEFGIDGYDVAPAGTYEPNTGHHHLLIDTGLPALDQPIPADDNHVHFGKGQTSTTLELAPGEHTLQLLLGDGNHVPHGEPLVSEVITITVAE